LLKRVKCYFVTTGAIDKITQEYFL